MSEEIKTSYQIVGCTFRDVEIVLLEAENRWQYTVNGSKRTVESLSHAKVNIDNALDRENRKKFTPIPVYLFQGCDGFKPGRITSFIAGRWGQYAWVTINGRCTKEPVSRLYLQTESNNELIREIKEIDRKTELLCRKKCALLQKVEALKFPKEDV